MDTVVVPKIVFKSSVLAHVVFEEVLKQLLLQLKAIPDVQKFKFSNEFVQLVCTVVENTIKRKHKIDKKHLVISILVRLFDLKPEDEPRIAEQIDFLINNKLVKKAGNLFLRKSTQIVSKLLQKK